MVIAFRNYAAEFGLGAAGTYMGSEKKNKKKNPNTPHTAALTVSLVALWSLRADQ